MDCAICTLGQNLARCPRTTLEVGWWLRRASSTVLVQQGHHCHVAPCLVCVFGLSQPMVLVVTRLPLRPTQFGHFPRKNALDTRLPLQAQFGDQLHDLSVVRPTLSPVEIAGIPSMCCVSACVPPLPFALCAPPSPSYYSPAASCHNGREGVPLGLASRALHTMVRGPT